MSAVVPGKHEVARAIPSAGVAESLLQSVADRLPVLARVLGHSHSRTVRSYVRQVRARRSSPSLQSRNDLLTVVHEDAERLLGTQTAECAARALEASASVLTANHHGVDFFAQSVQGTLALALGGESAPGEDASVVLACGAVPLNNLTYPRGLIAYSESDVDAASPPVRLPLFADREKRTLVCAAPAYDAAMLQRLDKRLGSLASSHRLSPSVSRAASRILEHDYGAAETLALASYSEQATVAGHRLFRRLAEEPDRLPPLVQLELERVASRLIQRDLGDDSSLVSMVLFEPELRERVLSLLDGERACWDRAALARRMLGAHAPGAGGAGAGTIFFWALDRRGRRVPLAATTDRSGTSFLRGLSDAGDRIEITLTPRSLARALKDGLLLPSLFMSYLCLALARGVNCLGGYYQAEYLPVMQGAVVGALGEMPLGREVAMTVRQVTTDSYLSGMQMVCIRNRVGALVPAGPLEIVAAGGLTRADLVRMASTSVWDAHLASLVETVADAAPDLVRQEDWRVELAKELDSLLKDDVVVKSVPG